MLAKIKATGEIIKVIKTVLHGIIEGYLDYENKNFYYSDELELTEQTVLEGWVAIDEWGIGGCFLHTQKPHAESREFCDTGDYEIGWNSDGDKFELDKKLFPDMNCESEPKKIRLTITPIEE